MVVSIVRAGDPCRARYSLVSFSISSSASPLLTSPAETHLEDKNIGLPTWFGLKFGLGLEISYQMKFELAKTFEWFGGWSHFSAKCFFGSVNRPVNTQILTVPVITVQ